MSGYGPALVIFLIALATMKVWLRHCIKEHMFYHNAISDALILIDKTSETALYWQHFYDIGNRFVIFGSSLITTFLFDTNREFS